MKSNRTYPVNHSDESIIKRQGLNNAVNLVEYGQRAFPVGDLDVLLGDDKLSL